MEVSLKSVKIENGELVEYEISSVEWLATEYGNQSVFETLGRSECPTRQDGEGYWEYLEKVKKHGCLTLDFPRRGVGFALSQHSIYDAVPKFHRFEFYLKVMNFIDEKRPGFHGMNPWDRTSFEMVVPARKREEFRQWFKTAA
jgi:hypothetical protein